MATSSSSFSTLNKGNLQKIYREDYAVLQSGGKVHLNLKKESGLKYKSFTVSYCDNNLNISCFHQKSNFIPDDFYHIKSDENETIILEHCLAADTMPFNILFKQFSELPDDKQRKLLSQLTEQRAEMLLSALLLKLHPNALLLILELPPASGLRVLEQYCKNNATDLISQVKQRELSSIMTIMPYLPSEFSSKIIAELDPHIQKEYLLSLELHSLHPLLSANAVKQCSSLSCELISDVIQNSSPVASVSLLLLLPQEKQIETFKQMEPAQAAKIIICLQYIEDYPKSLAVSPKACWWAAACEASIDTEWEHIDAMDAEMLPVPELENSLVSSRFKTKEGILLESVLRCFSENDLDHLTAILTCLNLEESALFVAVGRPQIKRLLEDVSREANGPLSRCFQSFPLIEWLTDVTGKSEGFSLVEEVSPANILQRLSNLSTSELELLSTQAEANKLIEICIIPALTEDEDSAELIKQLLLLMSSKEVVCCGWLLFHCIDYISTEKILALESSYLEQSIWCMFNHVTEDLDLTAYIEKTLHLLPADKQENFVRFLANKFNLFSRQTFQRFSKELKSALFISEQFTALEKAQALFIAFDDVYEAYTQLQYEQRRKINRQFSNSMWKEAAQKIPSKELHLWIDFDCELQVQYWLEKGQVSILPDLLSSNSIRLKWSLLENLPPKQIVNAFTLLEYSEINKLFQDLALHPKLPLLLNLWEQQDPIIFKDFVTQYCQVGTEETDYTKLALSFRKHTTQSKEQDHAATQFQAAYRGFKDRRKVKFKPSHGELVTLTNDNHNFTYYLDPKELFPPLRAPRHFAYRPPNSAICGTFKRCIQLDEHYIEFEESEPEHIDSIDKTVPVAISQEQIKASSTLLLSLMNSAAQKEYTLRTIVPGLQGSYIEELKGNNSTSYNRVIAAFGGVSLSNHIFKGSDKQSLKVNIQCFYDLCLDVSFFHQNGYYFRDIKGANLLIREYADDEKTLRYKRPQIKSIDLTTMCWVESDTGMEANLEPIPIDEPTGTPIYLTQEIAEKKLLGQRKHLETADNYALLLTIFESISPEFYQLERAPSLFKGATHKHQLLFGVKGAFVKGIMHPSSSSMKNRQVIEAVILKYIKTDYQDDVRKFLEDPIQNPLRTSLVSYVRLAG